MARRTWLISGCSTGLGRSLAETVLADGDRAVVTARNLDGAEAVAAGVSERALPLALDVTDPDSVRAAVAQAQAWNDGAIDVLVNNAGYGFYGAAEEAADDEIRRVLETNFFGAVRLTREVLPGMRRRRAGTIVNVGSIAGLVGGPGNGFYAASKFALEGYSEALHSELAPLGIRVILMEPSGIRTDFHGRSYRRAASVIEDYRQTAGRQIAVLTGQDGRQAGDPERIAREVRTLVHSENPPLRIQFGAGAVDRARAKFNTMLEEMDRWESLSRSTDFDG